MSEQEVASFLEQERTVTCATAGVRGWPHLMPLWYVLRDAPAGEPSPRLWAWTYAASQKVRNLERDARATLQVEAGEQYQELRGVTFECDVAIHRDVSAVAALGNEIFRRRLAIDAGMGGPPTRARSGIANRPAAPRGEPPVDELPGEVAAMLEAQAAKRVALEFVERRRVSWDHRKLGGVY
ncbi:MAG TPA: pyridoxamine 5'-phosphate oxidase family protein [Solirubrobacteraceae bacterium]|nr:pyridoxamine 5'-phosphate oxidase family protein [Solirubrobacteraceae bacterium]